MSELSSSAKSSGSSFSAEPMPPSLPPAPAAGGTITTLKVNFTNTQTTDQYVTFGQVFVPGHIPAGNSVTATYDDGTLIPIQVDSKATHADGSLRHAVITLKLTAAAAGINRNVNLVRTTTAQTYTPIPAVNLLAAGFDSVITINQGGTVYSASAAQLLASAASNPNYWLKGNMATEWILTGPLTNSQGVAHPHLAAQFLVRTFASLNSARVSVAIDNDYSYVASPGDQSYILNVSVGGQPVISNQSVTHFNHARWRKVFYWGQNPQENIQHQTSYLLSTRAMANYDASVIPNPATMQSYSTQLSTTRDIMDIGIVMANMEGTGGRPEIGLLPGWTVQYITSQNAAMKDVVLTMGELAGSWSFHYRNEKTGNPLTLDEYPYATLEGNPPDTVNPATGKAEAFPPCVTCNSTYAADTAHQPDFAYIPYIVTGDFYYLEELQFWAAGNLIAPNPYYRQFGLGILNADQVRGQAWTLRSVAYAAYISPDNNALKAYFLSRLENNIKFFSQTFTGPTYNTLGVNLEGGYALAYNGNAFAPWMDNFFTSVLGVINDMGYTDVAPAYLYKVKFPISLMTSPQFCWILATAYNLAAEDTGSNVTYTSLDQVWKNTPGISASYGLPCNGTQMQSVFSSPSLNYFIVANSDPEGYTAVLQSALAFAANSGVTNGRVAWDLYQTGSDVPIYTNEPQFDIVPRQ